jgi:NADH dehydrogenase FAD-containing subunit
MLSINVGSAPNFGAVEGGADWMIPSKPVPQLLAGWARLQAAARAASRLLRVLVVGGGAGGVELTLAMHAQLKGKAEFTLVHRGRELLPGHNARVRARLAGVLQAQDVEVLAERSVAKVSQEGVEFQTGEQRFADFVFWVTQPAPPAWLRDTGLALTEDGFVRVGPTLQAVGRPWIFAAGDVAGLEPRPVPKSGVFAVRMAAPLAANLRAMVAGGALRAYRPQNQFLSLIGTADGRAVASRGRWAWHSRLMWIWKNAIDRRFVRHFGGRGRGSEGFSRRLLSIESRGEQGRGSRPSVRIADLVLEWDAPLIFWRARLLTDRS